MQEKEWEISGSSLYYEIRKNTVVITRFQGLAAEVVIPEQIENFPVACIAKKAFLSKKLLRKVILPKSLKAVEDWAFAYCDNLEQVTFQKDVFVSFGKSVFLDCKKLRFLNIAGKEKTAAALLAAAVTSMEAYYLLNLPETGEKEWYAKWDNRMLDLLYTEDIDGYSKQVLCGEEDYGSTDLNAFIQEKRKGKVRLLFLRLLYPTYLSKERKEELENYLKEHTKGCESEETWQVILEEHSNDREYYQLFTEIGCMNENNFDVLITDIGDAYPEMKAFLIRYKEKHIGNTDFFAQLDLDF